MKIVDAQVHIWGANTPQRPWPARAEPHHELIAVNLAQVVQPDRHLQLH